MVRGEAPLAGARAVPHCDRATNRAPATATTTAAPTSHVRHGRGAGVPAEARTLGGTPVTGAEVSAFKSRSSL